MKSAKVKFLDAVFICIFKTVHVHSSFLWIVLLYFFHILNNLILMLILCHFLFLFLFIFSTNKVKYYI